MASDLLTLQGSLATTPQGGSLPLSGFPSTLTQFDERQVLDNLLVQRVELTADAPVAVNFGALSLGATVVQIKCVGGKVRVRVTSTDGATQAIPVDTFALWFSNSVPVTALDLTRVPGVATTVEVILGHRAG